MTVYYVDPANGSDSANGLSWATAWASLRGLRASATVPGPGDEIRLAQSQEYTPSLGAYTLPAGSWVYPYWYFRGESVFTSFEDPRGTIQFREGQDDGSPSIMVLRPVSCTQGTLTVDMPASALNNGSNYASVHATAYQGEYNTPDTVLWGCNFDYKPASVLSGLSGMAGAIRCHVPYSGLGDGDMPAGALAIAIYSGAALIVRQPLPAIRNSSEEWTPYEITFPPLPYAFSTNLRYQLERTAAPLSRDASPFGMELTEVAFLREGGIGATDTVLLMQRGPASLYSGGTTSEIAGENLRLVVERLNPIDFFDSGAGGVSLCTATARIGEEPDAYVRCYRAAPTAFAGAAPLSPPGSAGVYDLNGSAGGSSASPLRILGGWNPGTDSVEGITVYTAGLTHRDGSRAALLDLGWADHVHVENMAAAYGFASLVARPGTLRLVSCGLPWSLRPPFGEVTSASHITLESTHIPPLCLDGLGVVGDLSLVNIAGQGASNSKSYRYSEVRNLYMHDAHVHGGWLLHVRGDALLERCSLAAPPRLVSLAFGHTLTFRDHKPFLGSARAYWLPTAAESRWDAIVYDDTSMPTYTMVAPATAVASADARVTVRTGTVPPTAHPTALKGNASQQTYLDGVNYFSSAGRPQNTGSSGEYGYLYTHLMGRQEPYTSILNPLGLASYGDVAAPLAYLRTDEVAGSAWTDTPAAAPAGRVFLVGRFANIRYRTEDTVFLMAGRITSASGKGWTVLKALHVPRAGEYQAHFGCMKENLQFNFSYSGEGGAVIQEPLTMQLPSSPIASGELLGLLGVRANALVGRPKEVPLYSTTAEEAASGGGNQFLDEWHDYRVDFSTTGPCLVELRLSSTRAGAYPIAIFDTLAIYAK